MRIKILWVVYQGLDSLLKQILPIFRVEVSDHVASYDRWVVVFSCSKLISEWSLVGFVGRLTPLQVGSRFRPEAGGLKELGE